MGTVHNRRSALGILAAGPIAMLPALAVMQCSKPVEAAAVISSSWNTAFEAWRRADHLEADYHAATYAPTMAELDRWAPFTLPWFEVRATNGQVASFRFDPDNPNEWDNHMSPQLREAAAAVRAKVQARSSAWNDLNCAAIEEESDRLQGEASDAEYRVMETPAPDAAALLWKIERMFGDEDGHRCFNEEVQEALLADARRLLSVGRA